MPSRPAEPETRPAGAALPGPRRRQVRMAYFVSSYRSQAQVERLVRTLRRNDPQAHVVVLHNAFESPLDPAPVEAVGGHVHFTRVPVVWGDMTLEAERHRVLRWMVAELDFDWVVTLSEQDYPIAAAADLHAALGSSPADAFIEAWPVTGLEEGPLARDVDRRYGFTYRSVPASWARAAGLLPAPVGRRVRRVAELGAAVLERAQPFVRLYLMPVATGLPAKVGVRSRTVPGGRALWWGSGWYALSRRAAQVLLERLDAEPALVEHFGRTIIPTEALVATVLCTDPRVRVDPDALHAVRWSDPSSGRPDEFGEGDLEELVSSGRFFARKFRAGSAVLDRLDRITTPAAAAVAAPDLRRAGTS